MDIENKIKELIEVEEKKYIIVENKQERQEVGLNYGNWIIYEADKDRGYNG